MSSAQSVKAVSKATGIPAILVEAAILDGVLDELPLSRLLKP